MSELQTGATAVITHRVCQEHLADYEAWLKEIAPVGDRFPGQLDMQIIRPIEGLTGTYTVVLRYDSPENLKTWLESPERKELIDRVRPYLAEDGDFYVRSGLDFWFMPDGARAQVPVRWKQALMTWTAIYPMVLLIPMAVSAGLRAIGIPQSRPFDSLVISMLMVALMVYLVMPRYTKLLHRWLFK